METHTPLAVSTPELLMGLGVGLGVVIIPIVVFVLSMRRNRLDGRSVLVASAIALIGAWFWPLWILMSLPGGRESKARLLGRQDSQRPRAFV